MIEAAPPGRGGGRAAPGWRASIVTVAAVAYAVVTMHTPVSILEKAAHDDGWFIRAARSILNGQWLGDYSQYTLMKGAGYPLFLAAGAWSGLPSTLWTSLFRMLAVGVLAAAVARVTRSRWLGVVLFVVVLWHPVSWTAPLLRVTRDTIYSEQLMLALGALTLATLADSGLRSRIAWALAAGLVLGWFWETREEGIWILPGLAVLALGAWMRERSRRRLGLALVTLAAIAGFAAVELAIRAANARHYDTWVDVEFREAGFRGAVAAMQSVDDLPRVSHVPVPRDLRARLYEVSPAMATLKPSLDPPSGSPWQWGCQFYPWTCGDIAGGWFVWALRDAAAAQGHYGSPAAASRFYRQLQAEIEAACRGGRLHCERTVVPFMTPMAWHQLSELPALLRQGLGDLLLRRAPRLDASPSFGSPGEVDALARVLNRPDAAPFSEPRFEVSGWYYRRGGGWLSVSARRVGDRRLRQIEPDRLESPDLRAHLGDPAASRQRFQFVVDGGASTLLELRTSKGARREISLSDVAPGPRGLSLGDGTIYFERVVDSRAWRRTDPRALFSDRWRARALLAYRQALLPILLVGGLAALAAATVRQARARRLPAALVLAFAALVLVASRLLVLAMVDLSSFPAVHLLYMSPASHLSVVAGLLAMRAAVGEGASRPRPESGWSWMALRTAAAIRPPR